MCSEQDIIVARLTAVYIKEKRPHLSAVRALENYIEEKVNIFLYIEAIKITGWNNLFVYDRLVVLLNDKLRKYIVTCKKKLPKKYFKNL